MRTLSLLRHAKSSWDDTSIEDFERRLAPRGRNAAPLMGRHMRDIGLEPDLVLCSSAVRTRETAKLALPELGRPNVPVAYDDRIYEASAGSLLARLQQTEPSVTHLLMIGHNPGLQHLVLTLTNGEFDAAHLAIREKFPTGALVVLELDIRDWNEIKAGCGMVRYFTTPRQLRED